jgi:hypothetical protein
MTAKRETKKQNLSHPVQQNTWNIFEYLKDDPIFVEAFAELQMQSKKTESQLRDEAMLDFANSLHSLPARQKTSAVFDAKWQALIEWHEEKEKAWLSKKVGGAKFAARLVKRSWTILNHSRNAYVY